MQIGSHHEQRMRHDENGSVATAPSSLIIPAEPVEVLVTWNGVALPVEKFLA